MAKDAETDDEFHSTERGKNFCSSMSTGSSSQTEIFHKSLTGSSWTTSDASSYGNYYRHTTRSSCDRPSRFHRWTSKAPAISLSLTLIIFIAIVGFFLFHAVFTPSTQHKPARVRSVTHTSAAESGTKGKPGGKDLSRLTEIDERRSAHSEFENEQNIRRVRQNLAADYVQDLAHDTEQDLEPIEFQFNPARPSTSEFLIQRSDCRIPDLSTRPILRGAAIESASACDEKLGTVYGIGKAHECCYQVITHLKKTIGPESWNSLVCTPFDPQDEQSEELLAKFDFVRIECKTKSTNGIETASEFRFSIPLAHVRSKIQYWIDHSDSPAPPNVLILGLDGVSRRKFHTSFPLTLNILLENDFIDLKGYHVVGPKTLDNLIPLLMGIPKNDLPDVCNHRWQSYWDNCPFMWKHFDRSNYVTFYAEDIPDSFNYGNQFGFESKPTDYYFRPLLLEKVKYDNDQFCFGNTTTTEVLLQYLEKFVDKFKQFGNPFFAFTWLNLQRLGSGELDLILHKFFKRIKLSELLQNTLVILLSDHGIQTGIMRQGYEGYLDQRLPMAFVKLSSSMKHLAPAVASNSRELTTPFDLYETLMAMLKESNASSPVAGESMNNNRGLLQAKSNRTCLDADISPHWCTCNVEIQENIESSSPLQRHLTEQGIIAIAMSKLNEMVRVQREALVLSSTKSKICLELTFDKVTYVGRTVSDKETWLDHVDFIVLGLQVHPFAQFEVHLRQEEGEWEVLLPILRTDSNKGYIFCVNKYAKSI